MTSPHPEQNAGTSKESSPGLSPAYHLSLLSEVETPQWILPGKHIKQAGSKQERLDLGLSNLLSKAEFLYRGRVERDDIFVFLRKTWNQPEDRINKVESDL